MISKKERLFKKENHISKYFIIFIILIIVSFFIYFIYNNLDLNNQIDINKKHKEICIKKICIKVEIAKTENERNIGLMYKEYLSENEGMFFIFENEDKHQFWMKNTFISLDIIWINRDFEIVDIIQAEPCVSLECDIYKPREKALYVLEVNKGFSLKNNIMIGDKILIND
jgi:uncharacterized protein